MGKHQIGCLLQRFSERLALAVLRLAFPEWFQALEGPVGGFLLLPLEAQCQIGVAARQGGGHSSIGRLRRPLVLGHMRTVLEHPTTL
jgi:hypothetical protein